MIRNANANEEECRYLIRWLPWWGNVALNTGIIGLMLRFSWDAFERSQSNGWLAFWATCALAGAVTWLCGLAFYERLLLLNTVLRGQSVVQSLGVHVRTLPLDQDAGVLVNRDTLVIRSKKHTICLRAAYCRNFEEFSSAVYDRAAESLPAWQSALGND